MAEKRTFHDFVGVITDVSVLLREICIVALFFLLFFLAGGFQVIANARRYFPGHDSLR